VVDDLPDVELRRLALSLNKLQEGGEWDPELVRLEINEIIEISGDFEIPGFDVAEIEAFRFGVGDEAEPDPADDFADLENRAARVVSRSGDLWCLGDHRILCGSARDGAALSAVLDGELADAVFTDPPYNVKINGHVRGRDGGYAEFAEASGEMSPAAFTAFLEDTLAHAAAMTRSGGVVFACMDWRHIGEIKDALAALGLQLLNMCVWVKTNPGMGSLYRSQHELVFVARRPGASHTNNVKLGQFGRNRSNVWHYAGATGGRHDVDDAFDAHPTVKPIRMVMDALLDVTAPGDLVVDPFLGSGTTLLAAERTRRRAVGVEIEPAYVDLAIRRWQEMTGDQAVHAESGVPFDELEAREDEASATGPHAAPEEGF
jgi:DNA modification methylase